MLIEDFRHIRGLDALGCSKLFANVSALEQILAVINCTGSPAAGTSSESYLSSASLSELDGGSISNLGYSLQAARDYYRLAAVGADHVIETIPVVQNRFTPLQYQAIFDVLYRTLEQSQPTERSIADIRAAYQNQLVRLKYLVEDS
jgi:hypothetical protein